MDESQNFTATIEGSTAAYLHFSGELPNFIIKTVAPTEHIRPEEQINLLKQELGHATLAINDRDQRIAELEEQVNLFQEKQTDETAHLGRVAIDQDGKGPLSAEGDKTQPLPDIAPVTESSKPLEQAENEEFINDPTLSPAHQRYEKAILYLLRQPEQKLKHENAGGHMRSELEMEGIEFGNLLHTLAKNGIIDFEKSSPRRLKAIMLNVERLLVHADKPFITKRILDVIRGFDNRPPEVFDSTIEPTHDGTEHNGNGKANGNGNGHANRQEVSARVKRMLADEPLSGPTYRVDGKAVSRTRESDPTFLARRQGRRKGKHVGVVKTKNQTRQR